MPRDEQPINQSERDRWHDEQVHRGDAIRVVAKERFPSLRGRTPPPRHILGHAPLADIDTKLEEFTMDSRRSPLTVSGRTIASASYILGNGRQTPTNISLSIEMKGGFLGLARRSTLICCLSTKISTSQKTSRFEQILQSWDTA
jgi:hypothetical protein